MEVILTAAAWQTKAQLPASNNCREGLPLNYTSPCKPEGQQQGVDYFDSRQTLVGNSWRVPVIAWLLRNLTRPLGLTPVESLGHILLNSLPGGSHSLQGFLNRPPLRMGKASVEKGVEFCVYHAPSIFRKQHQISSTADIRARQTLAMEGSLRPALETARFPYERLGDASPVNLPAVEGHQTSGETLQVPLSHKLVSDLAFPRTGPIQFPQAPVYSLQNQFNLLTWRPIYIP